MMLKSLLIINGIENTEDARKGNTKHTIKVVFRLDGKMVGKPYNGPVNNGRGDYGL